MRLLSYALALVGVLAPTCVQSQQHAFDVKDDIAMWRINEPHFRAAVPGSEYAEASPDGRFAAIIITRGILKTDLIESEIVVFDLDSAARFLDGRTTERTAPRVIASVESYPHHVPIEAYSAMISDLRWATDSRHVFFRTEGKRGNYQLCRADVLRQDVQYLTPAEKSVDHFDVVGNTVVYTAGDPEVHLIDPGTRINRDAVDITGARVCNPSRQ